MHVADREQFLDIARKLNGSDFDRDNATDYAVCWQTHNCEQTSFHMAQLLAGLTQTQVREGMSGFWVRAVAASCLCKHWHSGWLCAAALKQTCRGGVSSKHIRW